MSRSTGAGVAGADRGDQTSGTLADERSARGGRARRRGDLYIVVEVSGSSGGREILIRQLLETVRSVYYGWQGSVTAGLQRALHEANAWLFEENRNSMPGEQCSAGISCAVRRDDDLFIAQVGPAAAFVIQGGKVTRCPEVSPWLDDMPPTDVEAPPLGVLRDPDIALFHSQLGPGDSFLLVETALARRLPLRTLTNLAARTPAAEMPAAIEAACGTDLASVAVTLADGPASSAPATAHTRGSERTWFDSIRQRWGALKDRLGPSTWLRDLARRIATALSSLGAALLTLFQRTLPTKVQAEAAHPIRPGKKPEGTEPPSRPSRSPQGQHRSQGARRPLIALAIAIPLLVAVVVLAMYIQRSQAQRAEIETLWQKATDSWASAQAAVDKLAIRSHLTSARDYVDQVLSHQPERSEAADLRKRIEARLDEINEVRRITWVQELAAYPSDARLTRVVVEGEHVFVLDRNAGKVYHHELDRTHQALENETRETVLVKRGDQVGSVLVADLVDMAWVAAGGGRQRASLVILDSGGHLLDYEPTTAQLTVLQVSSDVSWQLPRLVGSYFGRFYVLDPAAKKIWRYQPTATGYSDPPDDWLKTEVDLTGVVDMAIGDSIFLLYGDGTVLRLTTGTMDSFDASDWDSPPNNPGALFTRPPDEVKSVYLADRGNSRIVQCSVEGRFQRQFKLIDTSAASTNSLSAVTSLFVNEISGQAFFLSRNKLYMAVLPE